MIVLLAVVVACASAIRSTWSPCGLSMLSSINPLTERARGRRYATTAACFVAGATLGGATLGLLAAFGAAAIAALDPSWALVATVAGVAALVTVSSDVRRVPWRLPDHPRQVDQAWLGRYRSWVYGGGFGYQIGFGLATYIMTGGVYLTIVLAVLTGAPAAALAVGATFGFVRGLAVLLGARGHTHADLVRVQRALDRLGEPVRVALIVVQLAVAVVFVAAAQGAGAPVAAAALVAWTVLVGAGPVRVFARSRRSTRHPAPVSAAG